MKSAKRLAVIRGTLANFEGMSWQDARALLEMVF